MRSVVTRTKRLAAPVRSTSTSTEETVMDRITLPMEWKAAEEDGTLTGYASTFGNIDLGDDVIEPGAFTKTLRDDIKGAGIPMLADHMAVTSSVLGTLFDGTEDSKGLQVKARFSQAPSAQDVYIKAREGHLRSMSIGYMPSKFRYEERDGRQIRVLEEIKLFEVSVVVFPMNPQATIDRVKALADDLAPAERKALADELRVDPVEEPEPGTETAVDDEQVEHVDTDEPADDALTNGGPDDDPTSGAAPSSGSDDAEAAHVEATDPDTGKSVTGWDRWSSEAILAGRDPGAVADPAEVAWARERMRLNDEALTANTNQHTER
ncbi:HK97 family phage prohead protease [Naumannella sp. ID2617S]|nr:HK97 family phage prohead protease [Naumannella sp. ID2617S]